MTKKLDINGVEPKVGDLVVYNPPYWKGIRCEVCIGFSKRGLPQLVPQRILDQGFEEEELIRKSYTPKTGFAVINITKQENVVYV